MIDEFDDPQAVYLHQIRLLEQENARLVRDVENWRDQFEALCKSELTWHKRAEEERAAKDTAQRKIVEIADAVHALVYGGVK